MIEKVDCTVISVDGEVAMVPDHILEWARYSEDYYISNRIGHEIVDHFHHGQFGGIEAELVAVGVFMWHSQRYTTNQNSFSSPGDRLVNDLISTFAGGDWSDLDVGAVHHYKPRKWHSAGNMVADALDAIAGMNLFDALSEGETSCSFVEKNKDSIIQLIIHGYKEAKKKYKGIDPYYVFLTRNAISDACERFARQNDLVEDMKLQLEIDYYACSCEVEVTYDPYEEFYGDEDEEND